MFCSLYEFQELQEELPVQTYSTALLIKFIFLIIISLVIHDSVVEAFHFF